MIQRVFCLIVLQCLITPHSGAGEGIEKVSYLLQYGPGVHTVFEQQSSPGNGSNLEVKDRVVPSIEVPGITTAQTIVDMEQILNDDLTTLAETESDLEKETVTEVYISETTHSTSVDEMKTSTATSKPSDHVVVKNNTEDSVVPLIQGPASETMTLLKPTTHHSVDLSNIETTTLKNTPSPLKREDTSETIDPGSTISEAYQHKTLPSGCRAPVSVLRKLQPLPQPPPLPAFGSTLRTDVMVNLKPKELRTLMSTYIGLIEAYKSFNQQQRKNIAQLEEELARHELVSARAQRLSNTKLQIVKT
ncbi:hypothetical protein ZHAS_00013789 [Anopheles sinensis]|uniref:Uncharacterized protein n=1 Tax=Anopheles sinensis TaxID=74873 RepID=A0A084W6G5_ANOSI|nr:hypothetical protein ZHAS_00013789 [Anopheles sinensis]